MSAVIWHICQRRTPEIADYQSSETRLTNLGNNSTNPAVFLYKCGQSTLPKPIKMEVSFGLAEIAEILVSNKKFAQKSGRKMDAPACEN